MKWRQKLGARATCNELINVFKQAGYETYAEFVKGLVKNIQIDTGDSNRNAINQTRPLPVFPSESEQSSESPSYAAAAEAKLLQEDVRLGTKDVIIFVIMPLLPTISRWY